MAWRSWLPDRAMRPWQAVLLGAALAATAAAVQWGLQGPLGRDLAFIVFFPALIAAAALGGFVGGVACLLVAGLAAVWLLTPFGPSTAWILGSFWIAGGLVVAVAAGLADSVRELRLSRSRLTEAQAQLQTLVGELAHRSRNALFVIMSIVSQSARAAGSATEAERLINARLQALLRAQEAVQQADGASADLRTLLEKAVEPFDLGRLIISAGPEVQVGADVAVGLGLLFHELATNALKYGALSSPHGRILVDWTQAAGATRFVWREAGGPAVTEPQRQGFGARLLDAALVPQGGKAERRFEPEGLVCELHIPETVRVAARSSLPGAVFAARASGDVA